MRVGVDTGGTFTDLVTDRGQVVKVPSTPADAARAVRDAIAAAYRGSGPRPALLAHGTTVATNALLQARLARVALVVNRGFADEIEIARQARPSLYDQHVDRPPALVARVDRHEVSGRLDGRGRVIEAFAGRVPAIDPAVDAVAVCLLHSDVAPETEREVAAAVAAAGFDVTASADVSPEFREYERMVTTVVNAGLRPVCRPYLRALEPLADDVAVMTSAGGLVPLAVAAEAPASLLLSGPAGGVLAAAAVAEACGFGGAVAFDMGGTSTDVCLVRDGVPEPTPTRVVAGYPIRLPGLAVHTIGAGGGSVARLDAGGALVVGPESAGAVPGPAAYGRGGTQPTVTDADLVLGRIPAGSPLPGLGALDVGAARTALARAGIDAAGVVAVVDAAMERAVRAVTVARGVDPRELALVAFGGAGPLHACAVADGLGMRAVVVPARAGAFSALGLLCAPEVRELVRSWPVPADHAGLDEARERLAREAVALLTGSGPGPADQVRVESALDCRFVGQSHELTVADVGAFAAEHERRNGFTRPDVAVEVVAIRARASRPSAIAVADVPPVSRAPVAGPAVVAEEDCTVWIPDGWRASPHPTGAWILTRSR